MNEVSGGILQACLKQWSIQLHLRTQPQEHDLYKEHGKNKQQVWREHGPGAEGRYSHQQLWISSPWFWFFGSCIEYLLLQSMLHGPSEPHPGRRVLREVTHLVDGSDGNKQRCVLYRVWALKHHTTPQAHPFSPKTSLSLDNSPSVESWIPCSSHLQTAGFPLWLSYIQMEASATQKVTVHILNSMLFWYKSDINSRCKTWN